MGGKYTKECYKIRRRPETDKYGSWQMPLPVSVHTVINFQRQKKDRKYHDQPILKMNSNSRGHIIT
jgi:hypothetical protein